MGAPDTDPLSPPPLLSAMPPLPCTTPLPSLPFTTVSTMARGRLSPTPLARWLLSDQRWSHHQCRRSPCGPPPRPCRCRRPCCHLRLRCPCSPYLWIRLLWKID